MASRGRAFCGLLLLQIMASLCSYTLCDRFDGSTYDHTETRGNSTFGCYSSGPCTPCSYSEKSNDETYHCSTTGYRQSYRCVELGADDKSTFRQSDSSRGLHQSIQGLVGRKVAEKEDSSGRQVLYIYSSCVPTNKDEKLSVLGFEGIVLGLLALSAPVVYHRRRRNFSASGMSRLPTSVRF